MTISVSASDEEADEDEIYPNIAAVAASYGDKSGAYLNFVKKSRPEFMKDPYMFWNQPWGMNEFAVSRIFGQSPTSITSTSGNKNWNIFPNRVPLLKGLKFTIKVF
jgi:hypothetical protein